MQKIFTLIILCITSIWQLQAQNTFTLKSSTIGGQMTNVQEFGGFGCTGDNQSPALSWENAPEGTKSFAITMYDPDAPTGSGWWHWLVFDIPADLDHIDVNAGDPSLELMPDQVIQSITDYGSKGFGGPCPPEGHGWHQYIITIYALKVDSLGLDENTNAAVVGYYIGNNTLAKASIVSYYQRVAK